MTTDDPIRDLERQLVRAAGALASQPAPAPPRTRRRGWRLGIAALAVIGVASAAVIALSAPGDHSRLSVSEAAAAQLSPYDNGIVHLTYTSTFYDGQHVTQRARVSTWYSPSITRTVATTLDASGQPLSSLEMVTSRAAIKTYESSKDVVALEKLCPGHVRPATDPVARLRQLLAENRLTDEGKQQLDGITVRRLRTSDGPLNIVFFVRESDSAPVAMTTDAAGVDRTVVRFTGHRRVADSPPAEKHLAMGPHPTSHHVRIAERCP